MATIFRIMAPESLQHARPETPSNLNIAVSISPCLTRAASHQCRFQLEPMPTEAPAGYSGTPLAKKLGIKASSRVLLLGAPDELASLLAPLPAGVVFESSVGPQVYIAHVFVTQREALAMQLNHLRHELRPDAALWVSWPKKASKVATTVTEDTIRELALPLGFVDVKVCAVSDIWSGLKLVLRKALR